VNPERDYEFWKQFPGLVWSNRHADNTVMIRASLVRPRLHILRAVASKFEMERLRQEWKILCESPLMNLSKGHREVSTEYLAQIESELLHAA
jgi:hypothetical protein